ncbi:MAG: ribonuclease J [Candidatus Subteraquimicrobiales bacterium]|nr:ribonuclease J [Candidatus Subteraquimicrobiales bacterium]
MDKKKKPKLKIISLGGLGEIGKNMMVIEYGRDIIVIDAGLMFPDEEMLGIDLVLPDFSYLIKNKDRVRAVILTHGHEDHTGALPYLLKRINLPVYGTKLTLGLVESKIEEHNLTNIKFNVIDPSQILSIGTFKIEFMRVCHSIPDGVGLAIHTPLGILIHTGDFKFDQTPIDGKLTDLEKFASFKDKNVLALLSDSTNAEVKGFSPSERIVGETLKKLFKQARKRVIVASFASHLHRIQQIINVAHQTRRKIAVSGRTMITNVEIGQKLGYLKIPANTLIDITEINKYKREEVAILCTGSQGEPLSALVRIASNEHKHINIERGDTVIVSARPIPGNEKSVSRTIDRLFKCGANVYYEAISSVHVSGHAAQEELKMMINLISPKYLIPIHGEFRHLKHHASLIKDLESQKCNIILASNGDVIEFKDSVARISHRIPAGIIYVDGLGVGDIGDIVLRDRIQLSTDGIFIVIVGIDETTGEIVAGPDLTSRGFVYVKESSELMNEAKDLIEDVLSKTAAKGVTDISALKRDIRGNLSRYLYEHTQRRPMILPIIIEV